jgi:spermidine/putrescine transport system ATP-binding protein
MHKVPRPERERRVEEMLRLVGLEGFERRSVHQLSGGQRQRVALARAIAVAPRVLLLDEPLGALDLALRRQMQGELVRLQKRLGTTFVHVTHDQEEAMAIADRVVLLNRGRIEDVGPPERVYLRPASLFAATFMGESNILEGRVVGVSAERLRVETALGALPVAGRAEAGDRVHLSLRPEQIALAPGGAGDWVSLGLARIGEVTFQGAHLRCQALANAATTVLLRVPVGSEAAAGATVPLHVRAADIVLLKD